MQIVRYQKVGKDKYKIFLDNKETITLYENVILANNLLLNKEIDKEKLDILIKQNDIEDLYSKVLSYIAYRIRSVKEVRGYLVKKGANEYLTGYIIDKLKKTGYLNDDLFCKYYILDKINLTLDGPFKMRKYLQDNDISNETIDKYLNSYEDNFKERIDTPLDEDGNKDYESINAIDTELFNDQLSRLLKGEEVILPTYNFITGQKEFKRRLKLKENAILIIEGLHSLNDELTKTIDKKNKYRIYISPLTCLNLDNHNRLNTTDNRLLRRLVRDNLRRGYNASETLDSWKRVRKGETEYVFPYQDKSDIVLNTSLIYEMNVLKVYAEPLLFSVNESDPNYIEAIRLINLLRMILPMPSASIPLDSVMREFIGNGCFE